MTKKFILYLFLLSSIIAFGQKKGVSDKPKIPSIKARRDTSLVHKPDSLVVTPDSLAVADSLKNEKKAKKPVLEADISYNATDSIITDLQNQKVYMYKGGVVQYQAIELKADYIELDLQKKEVYAEGLPDSTGTKVGTPVFKDGNDEFESQTLRYSFETQKGIIADVKTTQGDGIVHSALTKKVGKDEFLLKKGKYSTCDAEHPHFYLQMTRAKVISGKKIITGPAYMVLEDFPIYFPILPFGYFPNSTTYSSGILIPTYGEEGNRGFFLRDGGYYWAAGQFFDLTLRGDIYSKGSWGANVGTTYKKRYKFNGSFNFKYNLNKYGEGTSPSKGFSLQWTHAQDSKANPNRTFSASVNLSTSSYDKQNEYSAQNYLTTSKSSSISYTRRFENTPFNMSVNLRHSQNSRDSTMTLGLPELTFNMSKIYPFKDKNRIGKAMWYDKIGFSYSGNIRNSITAKENEVLKKSIVKDWQNGWQHNFQISLPNFNLFKYINVSPSISYAERWYTHTVNVQHIIGHEGLYMKWDTIRSYGFKRNYDYSYSISASTNIYGNYTMLNPNSKIKGIRHKMTPSVSYSYRPDFGQPKYGFYGHYYDENGIYRYYNRYENAIFGSAGAGRSGSVSFSLANSWEAKIKESLNDTVKSEGVGAGAGAKDAKLKILDLNLNTSYNLAADSLNLSAISLTGRTKIKGVDLNFGGIIDPYNIDRSGKVYNKYRWETERGLAKIGRLTSANLSFGMNFQSPKSKKEEDGKGTKEEETKRGPSGLEYYDFNIPWDLNFSYSLTYSKPKPYEKASIMQSVNFSGRMSLTENWQMNMNTNFDVQSMKFSFTTFSVSRQLHCWSMSFNFVPFGDRKSYSFTLNASSSMLKDLKVQKQRSWFDNNR